MSQVNSLTSPTGHFYNIPGGLNSMFAEVAARRFLPNFLSNFAKALSVPCHFNLFYLMLRRQVSERYPLKDTVRPRSRRKMRKAYHEKHLGQFPPNFPSSGRVYPNDPSSFWAASDGVAENVVSSPPKTVLSRHQRKAFGVTNPVSPLVK